MLICYSARKPKARKMAGKDRLKNNSKNAVRPLLRLNRLASLLSYASLRCRRVEEQMGNFQEDTDLQNTVGISARRFEESPFLNRYDGPDLVRVADHPLFQT
jgi:hypothetical protein